MENLLKLRERGTNVPTDIIDGVTRFVTSTMILFTFNIGNGLTAGLLVYLVFKLAAGRYCELTGGTVVLGLLCLFYFLFDLPH